MKLKTSFFNRTIYKKNLALFWPIWICFLLHEVIAGPAILWTLFAGNDLDEDRGLFNLLEIMNVDWSIFVIAASSLLIGMALFSYLFTAKSANMMHALPVSRLELFGTNLISGWTFLFVPMLAAFFLSVLICLSYRMAQVQYLLVWFSCRFGLAFFFFALAVFCAMFTGQIFAMPVYFIVCNILVEGIVEEIKMLAINMAYGVPSFRIQRGFFVFLSPIINLLNRVRITGEYALQSGEGDYAVKAIHFEGIGIIAVYMVVAVAIYIIAYVCYKKRRIESAGDLLTFHWIKPIFRWGVGICAGFLCGTLISEFVKGLTGKRSLPLWALAVFFCSGLFFFFAEMLVQKAFRVVSKGRCRECAAFLCFSMLAFTAIFICSYRESNYIPNREEVEFAYVNLSYPIEFQGEETGTVTELHREILERKSLFLNENAEWNQDGYYGKDNGYVSIVYRMKDHQVVSRSYEIPAGSECGKDLLGAIYEMEEQEENFLNQYIEYDYGKISRITDAVVEWPSTKKDAVQFRTLEGDGAKALYDAMIADAREGVLQKYNHRDYRVDYREWQNLSSASIQMYYYHEGREWQSMYDRSIGLVENNRRQTADGAEGTYGNNTLDRGDIYLYFGEDCTNILKVLVDYHVIRSVEEINFL